jgi:dolichol-phosphate mannosyltransferase
MSTYSLVNIVLPVYNEKDNITKTLDQIAAKIRTPYRIFIIYDFDEDNTLPVVREYINNKNEVRISLIKNKYGGGVLNAIKTGFELLEEGVILISMADLSDDIGIVDEMFSKINEGYDIVCGSRYSKGGGQIGGPLLKKLLSRMAGVSLHYLIGIPTRDVTNSFKMYTKKVINDINIESEGGFEIGMEIVLKAFFNGHKITEVPTVWRGRAAGGSRFRIVRWLPKYIRWYWFGVKNRFSKL